MNKEKKTYKFKLVGGNVKAHSRGIGINRIDIPLYTKCGCYSCHKTSPDITKMYYDSSKVPSLETIISIPTEDYPVTQEERDKLGLGPKYLSYYCENCVEELS